MRIAPVAALTATLLFPALAGAQAVHSMGNSQPSGKAHASRDDGGYVSTTKDGRLCKRREETGTRLGAHLDCRSKADWDEMAHDARQDTELHQRTGVISPQ